MAVDTVPEGIPTIPILATTRGNELCAFLEAVFEAAVLDRLDGPAGEPAYVTMRVGDSVLSIMPPVGGQPTRSAFYVYVRDVDAVLRRSVAAGARQLQEPVETPHGDRMGTVIDPFGNQWTIASSLERISVQELHRRLAGGAASRGNR